MSLPAANARVALALLVLVSSAPAADGLGAEQATARDFSGLLRDGNGDGQTVVLCFGDSITRGTFYGAYPWRLRKMLKGPTVVNAGNYGETSVKGRRRLPGVLDEVRPDYVVIIEGINDACAVDAVAQNLSAMVEEVRGRGAVPLVGTLFVSPRRERGRPARCAKQVNHHIRGLPAALVDLDRPMRHRWDTFTQDGIHPNGAGCALIAEAVAEALTAGSR
jgi:lysophospholipase L1-like esterase